MFGLVWQTVNVSAFEKHAGSSARHPSDYIYLDNGKNLHEVMDAGWKAAENGRKVSEALFKAMGPNPDHIEKNGCVKCGAESGEVTCSRCFRLYHLGVLPSALSSHFLSLLPRRPFVGFVFGRSCFANYALAFSGSQISDRVGSRNDCDGVAS